MRAPLALVATLLLGACGDEPPPPVEASLGGFTVRVVPGEARVVVTDDDGATLLDTGEGGLAVGRGDETIEHRFGMFRIEEGARDVATIESFADVQVEADGVHFVARDGDGERVAAVTLHSPAAGELVLELHADDLAADRVSIGFGCDLGEHFLGLGGQSFDVDHRGQRVPLWVSEDGISKEPTDDLPAIWPLVGRRHTTHTPIPAYVSSRGTAMLLQTPAYAVFDLCATRGDRVTLETWHSTLEMHLFAGPERTPAQAIELLTARVGRPRMPPAFAFAPWLDAIFGSANVRRVAARLRADDIPASVIWTEDWRGGEDTASGYALHEQWELDRGLYPDFETLADELHGAGFKLLTYHNSFLQRGSATYDEAVAGGHAIRDAAGAPYHFQGVTFEDTTLLDLTSEAARAWAKGKLAEGFAQGADGHMADFAEWLPTDAVLASGVSPLLYHNLYAVGWARLQREVIDEQTDGVERLFFARAAHLGSQALVDVLWAGDQQTDFSEGDGLPSVIPMGLGLGVVGFSTYGHDIAGYMSQLTAPSTRELWFRWVTLGALTPVMRTHHGRSARENWSWESDAASAAHLARWARFHQRLFPYLLAAAKVASETGLPIMRPLALAHPDFEPGWTATDQYMLGDTLYVAPVVTAGANGRPVQLPPGGYRPLVVADAGRDLRGGPPITVSADRIPVAAPLEDIPVFVRAGALLVLLPPEVDTVVASDDPSVVTLADIGDDREILAWGGGDATFTEAGGLAYTWQGASLTRDPTSATWNGAAVVATDGLYTVTGPGTLVVDAGTGGTATLTITGGAPDRTLRLRIAR